MNIYIHQEQICTSTAGESGGHHWVQMGGLTIYTPDGETADILAAAFNLCADRVRMKSVVVDAEFPDVSE